MDYETMLDMLKIDLGISTTNKYDDRLKQYLQTAVKEIKREGATLSFSDSVEDANLVIMYAQWLWRKRDSGEGMPRMIRWEINNRLFGGDNG
ncbi:MAG: hypothetical protein II630_00535 [Bacteroidales bacterium]|nr:hypothetical protein [Bacteroidales bacterium]